MTLKVTKEDIRKGMIGSTEYCPIAHSIRRIMGSNAEISATDTITIELPLTDKALRFIEKFDNEENVGPVSFTL